MRFLPQSLAGQMIAVTVVATVLTQSLIVIGVFTYADRKFDRYDDVFFFQKIARTLGHIEAGNQAQRDLVLETSNSDEIKFLLTERPRGTEPLRSSYRADELRRHFPDRDIQTSVRRLDILDVFSMVFGDLEKRCLLRGHSLVAETSCPHWTISFRLGSGEWLNVTSYNLADSSVYLVPVILSAFTSLIGIGGSIIVLARRITRPLRDLTRAAEQLGRGERVKPIARKGPLELAQTAHVFNQMQERLGRFVKDRTTMLAAINHDLRTPLTSLRLRAEFIDDEALRQDIVETTDEMRTMVNSYLEFSRQEATEEQPERVDLTAMLQSLAHERAGIRLAHSFPVVLSCRPVAIKRAFRNILDNGLKYGSEVRIEMRRTPGQVHVECYDNGPGIPVSSFEEVFTPFLRLDDSRNVSEGNVGLGLSIARSIVRKHGGDIVPFYRNAAFGMRISLPHEAMLSEDTAR